MKTSIASNGGKGVTFSRLRCNNFRPTQAITVPCQLQFGSIRPHVVERDCPYTDLYAMIQGKPPHSLLKGSFMFVLKEPPIVCPESVGKSMAETMCIAA